MTDFVVPGIRLCESDDRHVAGPGTYLQHGYIYSSLLGQLNLVHLKNNVVSVEVRTKVKILFYILSKENLLIWNIWFPLFLVFIYELFLTF